MANIPAAPTKSRSASLGEAARRALGGLVTLVDDPGVRDILVQARGGVAQLWVDRGAGTERVRGWEAPGAAVADLAVALIAAGGEAP